MANASRVGRGSQQMLDIIDEEDAYGYGFNENEVINYEEMTGPAIDNMYTTKE